MRPGLRGGIYSIGVVILVTDNGLGIFRDITYRIFFPLSCFLFFSCINTVYSLFYRMHMEEVNRLIQILLFW